MLRGTEKKVLSGLFLAIFVIAGIGAIFYSGTTDLIRDAQELDETHAVINTLSAFYTDVQDLRIATRERTLQVTRHWVTMPQWADPYETPNPGMTGD